MLYRDDLAFSDLVMVTQKKIPLQTIDLQGDFNEGCDPDRIRTCDLLIRSQLLYPAELRDLQKGALKNFAKVIFSRRIHKPFPDTMAICL